MPRSEQVRRVVGGVDDDVAGVVENGDYKLSTSRAASWTAVDR